MQQGSAFSDILFTPWERKLANDLAADFETYTGEKRSTVEEMRRFMAIKAYRGLLQHMQEAREGKESREALRSVAEAMRIYALERPALFAATFRAPATDTRDWQVAVDQTRDFMLSVFWECGLEGAAADHALRILWCMVRGFVLHEVVEPFCDPVSYEESYENAVSVFIAGLQALLIPSARTVDSKQSAMAPSSTMSGLTGR